ARTPAPRARPAARRRGRRHRQHGRDRGRRRPGKGGGEGLTETSRPQDDGSWLRDLILGGQDGLVNVLGIVLGVSAASTNVKVLLAAGLAATFAEGVSMGAVAWTSSRAQADHYEKERDARLRQLETNPEQTRRDLERIYG